MLSKIFKKDEAPSKTTSAAAKAVEAARLKSEAASAETAQQHAELGAAWQIKLQAAMGDDVALLEVAKESPVVDIKQAAVNAIAGEETLKLAEREFRTHDRRVHRAAKQRYEMVVARREAREGAAKLIEAAAALVKEEKIPANRLVELDRAWLALDIALIDPAMRSEFEALAADLATLTRERGAHQLAVNRWTTDAKQALGRLNVTCVDVAAGLKTREDLEKAVASANTALTAMPAGESTAQLGDGLQDAVQKAAHIEARLNLLEELEQPASAETADVVAPVDVAPDSADLPQTNAVPDDVAAAPNETSTPTPSPTQLPTRPKPADRWHALPALADAQIANALNTRFEQWQRAQNSERDAKQAGKRQQANDKKNAAKTERSDVLAAIVQKAEVAGHASGRRTWGAMAKVLALMFRLAQWPRRLALH